MNRSLGLLAALAVLFTGVAWSATDQPQAKPEVKIVRAEFGLFNSTESDEPTFVPSLTVPYEVNQAYGWVIEVETAKPTVKWREEFTLPGPPETWSEGNVEGNHTISSDRKTSVTERETHPQRGLIHNAWAVALGDPKGRYVIKVTIEGGGERTFEFEVK
jgi:hypothetical protein